MEETLYLHIPAFEELWYRRKIMLDPGTMGYNKGYDLEFEGYDPATGCIDFPREAWADWYAFFIGQEPWRYYAYIVRESDGAFIGEVNVHKNEKSCGYEMGIVLEAKYRGMGYSARALRLLLRHAFEELGADLVRNSFEAERTQAVRAHLAAGFSEYRQEKGILELRISREQYFRQKGAQG